MSPERRSLAEHAVADHRQFLTRRWFFRDCGVGLGLAALHSLLGPSAPALGAPVGLNPMAPRKGHFEGKAKRVIDKRPR